ncbi:cyclin [Sarracenia purpurea var. burkii]
MAAEESCARVTRLAKKRAAEAFATPEPQRHATKKRVVLGELRDSSNVPATTDLDMDPPMPKCRTKGKAKKAVTPTAATPTPPQEIDSKSEDPQMCSSFVSEIYEYLHNMEVSGFRNK